VKGGLSVENKSIKETSKIAAKNLIEKGKKQGSLTLQEVLAIDL